jgi:hypothetical protein
MWRYGVFGARIDNWAREPSFLAAQGDPHPDALTVESRVLALKRFEGFSFDDPSGLLVGLEGLRAWLQPRRSLVSGAALGVRCECKFRHLPRELATDKAASTITAL